jgi:hypothetical protein
MAKTPSKSRKASEFLALTVRPAGQGTAGFDFFRVEFDVLS